MHIFTSKYKKHLLSCDVRSVSLVQLYHHTINAALDKRLQKAHVTDQLSFVKILQSLGQFTCLRHHWGVTNHVWPGTVSASSHGDWKAKKVGKINNLLWIEIKMKVKEQLLI